MPTKHVPSSTEVMDTAEGQGISCHTLERAMKLSKTVSLLAGSPKLTSTDHSYLSSDQTQTLQQDPRTKSETVIFNQLKESTETKALHSIYGPSNFDEIFQIRYGKNTIPQPHSQACSLEAILGSRVGGKFPTSVTGQEGILRITDALSVTIPEAFSDFR